MSVLFRMLATMRTKPARSPPWMTRPVLIRATLHLPDRVRVRAAGAAPETGGEPTTGLRDPGARKPETPPRRPAPRQRPATICQDPALPPSPLHEYLYI